MVSTSDEFSAGPSALGYLYQAQYALLLLLRADSDKASIAIESLDDIVFEERGDSINRIQLKHHSVKSVGSLTNKCADLWRTLRVWSRQVSQGSLIPGDAILTIVTTGKAPKGSAASKLYPDRNERDIDSALRELTDAAHSIRNQKIKEYCDEFLSLKDNQRRNLINDIIILDSSPNIQETKEKIKSELRHSVDSNNREKFYELLTGWWFSRVILHLSNKSQDIISIRELDAKLGSIREQFYRSNLPVDFPEPLELNEDVLDKDERVFVEQMKLITNNANLIRTAIGDYYRGSRQRLKWVRENQLFLGELNSYDKRLVGEWKWRYDLANECLGDSSTESQKQDQGRELFKEIYQMDLPIRPSFIESYVMRGSYHTLSNRLKIGWHVEYCNRLGHLRQTQV